MTTQQKQFQIQNEMIEISKLRYNDENSILLQDLIDEYLNLNNNKMDQDGLQKYIKENR